MFNKHEEVIVDSARDVVLLLVEENAFESVDIQLIGICVLSSKNGVTKRKKSDSFIEERKTESR